MNRRFTPVVIVAILGLAAGYYVCRYANTTRQPAVVSPGAAADATGSLSAGERGRHEQASELTPSSDGGQPAAQASPAATPSSDKNAQQKQAAQDALPSGLAKQVDKSSDTKAPKLDERQ